ncbi:MAG: YeeE/YedE family protein [Winogradskyella sp.]|nr:YeeE/YedE family protein [Winogradskyella sp.]
MTKFLKFFLVGIFFGIVLVKSEAVSWYRIFEMFKFQSFHMYGIIGTAVITGVLLLQVAKRSHLKTTQGTNLRVPLKDKGFVKYIIGGSIFGLGWALCGACPGPMYILVGTGVFSMLIVIASALFGTFIYGILKRKLPH